MDVITRISSPLTESWFAWLFFAFFVFWVSKGMFLAEANLVFRGLFSKGERSYVGNVGLQYLTILYKAGIMALLIYMLIHADGEFILINYGIVFGVILATILVQNLLVRLVGVVFLSNRMLESALEQRGLIGDVLCGLMPLAIMLLYMIPACGMLVVIVLSLLYVGMILVKAIQLCYNNLLSVLYVLLYIISLEVIPLVGAILWIKNIIQ
jgi:hypothetical protein